MAVETYIFNSQPTEESVYDFLARNLIDMTPSEFLSFTDNVNLDSIVNQYSAWDQINNEVKIATKSSDLIIKPNTYLVAPKDKVNVEDIALYSEGQVLYQKDNELFLGSHGDLIENSKYKRSNKLIIKDGSIDISLLNETCRVWWYCLALDSIIDITPFISLLTTSKSNAGAFSIQLTPTQENLLQIKPIQGGLYINLYSTDQRITGLNYDTKNLYVADFFELYFQENDIFFIRFEELELDKENKRVNLNGLVISKDMLSKEPLNCWDMIGLVDKLSVSYNASSNNKSISINGRDFCKLFEEDGSYFLPYQFIQSKGDSGRFIWGGDENSSWFKRNMISGDFNSFFSYELKPIDRSLKFIINHLSNLGITPNSLWDSYKDRRSKVYSLGENDDVSKMNVNGVWGIVQLNIDNSVKERRISGENLINPSGSLISLINSICVTPFVEMIMDTYTDKFELTVRQPPFSREALKSVIEDQLYITVSRSDILEYNLENETEYYSYYKISPHGQLIGNEDGIFESIIPIINLPFFCERFGSKGYEVTDAYISRISIEGDNEKYKENSINSLIGGILNDLMYLIDSTVYLPFTRNGSITINGDRRIKVGSFIYFEATNEIFYVNSVQNSISIDNSSINRTTTLSVSRGMIKDNILSNKRGAVNFFENQVKEFEKSINVLDISYDIEEEIYSYFDIVDIEKLKEKIQENIDFSSKQVDFDVIINKKAFEYFTKRNQLIRSFR